MSDSRKMKTYYSASSEKLCNPSWDSRERFPLHSYSLPDRSYTVFQKYDYHHLRGDYAMHKKVAVWTSHQLIIERIDRTLSLASHHRDSALLSQMTAVLIEAPPDLCLK